MQILMPRVWGGARESAFLTSSGRVRAARRRTALPRDPEALARGQSAVSARDGSARAAALPGHARSGRGAAVIPNSGPWLRGGGHSWGLAATLAPCRDASRPIPSTSTTRSRSLRARSWPGRPRRWREDGVSGAADAPLGVGEGGGSTLFLGCSGPRARTRCRHPAWKGR